MPCAEDIVLDWLQYTKNVLKFNQDDPVFPKTLVKANSETMAFEAMGLTREHWADASPIREIFKKRF